MDKSNKKLEKFNDRLNDWREFLKEDYNTRIDQQYIRIEVEDDPDDFEDYVVINITVLQEIDWQFIDDLAKIIRHTANLTLPLSVEQLIFSICYEEKIRQFHFDKRF